MHIYQLVLLDKLNAKERKVMYWSAQSNSEAEKQFMQMNDCGFQKVQISEHEVLVARKVMN